MEAFLDSPAFGTYATCCAILTLKMIFSAFYTGIQRQRTQGYINEEDASTFGQQGALAAPIEGARVAHGLRIQRNDGESIPAFFAIALVFVLSGASASAAAIYFWTFTTARLLHTVFYTLRLQPWRAICFLTGALCLIGMSVQILLDLVRT